jgi:hypothetical protein
MLQKLAVEEVSRPPRRGACANMDRLSEDAT